MPIEDDDVVQTLAADRADYAFDVGFRQGERGAVRIAVRPKAPTVRPNAASKMVSRSCEEEPRPRRWGRPRGVAVGSVDGRRQTCRMPPVGPDDETNSI
jgi:hypothetical protein